MTEISIDIMTNLQDTKIRDTVAKERGRLLEFIRKRIPVREDAEDVLQDVFYELVESYRLMKPVEQLASWLFTVARNKITDLYRKKKPLSLEDVLIPNQNEEDEPLLLADLLAATQLNANDKMMQDAIMETIADALEELPDVQRDAFVMHELEGFSLKDIAMQTNVSVKTVISRKRYAVIYLRERLRTVYEEMING